jgi:hypothetical protein
MDAENKSISDVKETFKDFLTSKGLRVTNQRLAIFDAAYEHPDHFTAEDLLERSREIDDSVSRATVYRALPNPHREWANSGSRCGARLQVLHGES